jgi:hypothetical protein
MQFITRCKWISCGVIYSLNRSYKYVVTKNKFNFFECIERNQFSSEARKIILGLITIFFSAYTHKYIYRYTAG